MTRIFGILIAVLFLSVGHTASAQYSSELLKRAQNGDAEAQYLLGEAYLLGDGIEENEQESLNWYLKAAEQEYEDAAFMVASMYHDGPGALQDSTKAMKWYHRAAEKGDYNSMVLLAFAYAEGDGVIQDIVRAHTWLNIASSLGHSRAEAMMRILEEIMTVDHIFDAQKLARECVRKEYKDC